MSKASSASLRKCQKANAGAGSGLVTQFRTTCQLQGKFQKFQQAPPKPLRSQKRKISLPDGFGVSAAVTAWAAEKGFGQLDAHLDAFTRKAKAKGYTYVDWDAAFMEAIREDWAKLRGRAANGAAPPPDSTTKTGTDAAEATRREREARDKGAAPPPAHIRAQLASLTKKFTGAMA